MDHDYYREDKEPAKRVIDLTPNQLKMVVGYAKRARLDISIVVDWIEKGRLTINDIRDGIL